MEWGKLHNEELIDLYSSTNIFRMIKSRLRSAGNVACMGETTVGYWVFIGTPECKRPLWRPRSRWEDNTKIDLQEVGCGGMDWIELALDRDRWQKLVNALINLGVPQNARNFLTICIPVSF